MRSEEHENALSFVETNVEKGAEFAEAFRTALEFGEPWKSREAAILAARRIRRSAETVTQRRFDEECPFEFKPFRPQVHWGSRKTRQRRVW